MSEQGEGTTSVIQLLEQVETLLKESRLGLDFGRRGVNTSVALVAVQGLIAYFGGNKRQAAEDLATAAEEIRTRHERG